MEACETRHKHKQHETGKVALELDFRFSSPQKQETQWQPMQSTHGEMALSLPCVCPRSRWRFAGVDAAGFRGGVVEAVRGRSKRGHVKWHETLTHCALITPVPPYTHTTQALKQAHERERAR